MCHAAISRGNRARGHPELSFLGFDIGQTLARSRILFPGLASKRIEVCLQTQSTLACVNETGSACIRLHTVLNHPGTPERVIAFIIGHELLHLQMPSRNVGGVRITHPPEFWETEREMFPDRIMAWNWILLVLGRCLKSDSLQQGTFVTPSWRRLINLERPTIELISAMLGDRAEPQYGDVSQII